jgi:hypothetical protein
MKPYEDENDQPALPPITDKQQAVLEQIDELLGEHFYASVLTVQTDDNLEAGVESFRIGTRGPLVTHLGLARAACLAIETDLTNHMFVA